jgi:hypothetical protein
VFTAFDQQRAPARGLGGAKRCQAGGARADDGDVGLDGRLGTCH